MIGGALGLSFGRLLKAAGGVTAGVTPWVAVALAPIGWLVVAWHELGHAVGGWLSGFDMILFTAGPVKIVREGQGLRVRWNDSLSLWGGLAAMAPLDGRRRDPVTMRTAMVRIVAGGPVFSLLGGAAGLAGYTLFAATSPVWAFCFGFAGAFSLLIALLTLIPASMGGYKSDGLRLLTFFRGDSATAERWCNLAVLSGLSQTLRPRDWPEECVLACGAERGDRSNDGVSAAWLRAAYHEDRREWSEALLWSLEAVAGEDAWPEVGRPILRATAAIACARSGNVAEARRHLNEVRVGGLMTKYAVRHTEAVVLDAEGREEEARAAAEEALGLIESQPASLQAATREDLVNIKKNIKKGTA